MGDGEPFGQKQYIFPTFKCKREVPNADKNNIWS